MSADPKNSTSPTTSPGSHSGTADDVTPFLFHPNHGSSTVLRNVENSVVSQKTWIFSFSLLV